MTYNTQQMLLPIVLKEIILKALKVGLSISAAASWFLVKLLR